MLLLQVRRGTEEIWTRSGSQGNRWVAAKVEVGNYSGQRIFLEGTLKADHENSYVTIDDLYAYSMSCESVDVSSLLLGVLLCGVRKDFSEDHKA